MGIRRDGSSYGIRGERTMGSRSPHGAQRNAGAASQRNKKSRISLHQATDLETVPLLPVPRRKFLLDVLPPIQHAHDFRRVIDDTIEDDVGYGGKRP